MVASNLEPIPVPSQEVAATGDSRKQTRVRRGRFRQARLLSNADFTAPVPVAAQLSCAAK
jgi:hypothetical protein